jgi:hypothetical protein
MSDVIHLLVRTLLRVLLLLAGFVFFASVVLVAGLLLTLWLLRALWARLTGRAVTPWVFQMNRQPPWQRGGFAKPSASPDDVIDAETHVYDAHDDVTDVQPKRLDPH